jgi:hypothetical protein
MEMGTQKLACDMRARDKCSSGHFLINTPLPAHPGKGHSPVVSLANLGLRLPTHFSQFVFFFFFFSFLRALEHRAYMSAVALSKPCTASPRGMHESNRILSHPFS